MATRAASEAGLVGWAALTSAVVLLDVLHALRPLVVLPFVLFAPGWACVRVAGLASPLAEFAAAVLVSISLLTIVAGALTYAGIWSPTAVLAVMVTVTIVALAVGRVVRRK